MSAEPPIPSLLPAQPVALPLPPMCLRNEPGPFCTDILGNLVAVMVQGDPQCSHPPVQYTTGKGENRGEGVLCLI